MAESEGPRPRGMAPSAPAWIASIVFATFVWEAVDAIGDGRFEVLDWLNQATVFLIIFAVVAAMGAVQRRRGRTGW
ncbi:hypothetical protein [Conexibacter sp. SYSU D00693]|uniref:hypothetical protein n=1 Tax=Conexibacter sp. SYSU D00693 TaxID=2812560 RepID=UPI00196B09C9|nr:hypothetical protein [Conexibacter sp. SYSU D00693]